MEIKQGKSEKTYIKWSEIKDDNLFIIILLFFFLPRCVFKYLIINIILLFRADFEKSFNQFYLMFLFIMKKIVFLLSFLTNNNTFICKPK